MRKKVLILFGLIVLVGMTVTEVMAHSTIYTDELGRMHFLGKDPGAKTLQKIEDYSNPAQKDVTNAIYNASQKIEDNEANVSTTKEEIESHVDSATNPYKYGKSDIDNATPVKDVDQRHFWNW